MGIWSTPRRRPKRRPRPEAPPDPGRVQDFAGLVFVGAVLLFASPLRELWARDDAPWWAPYLSWAAVTVAAALVTRACLRDAS